MGYDMGIISTAMLFIAYDPHMEPVSNFWNGAIVGAPAGSCNFWVNEFLSVFFFA